MATSDLVFLVGRERSGTTVFRRQLAVAGALDMDETLHGDLSKPHRFYRMVADRVAGDPALASPQRHTGLWTEFIDGKLAEAQGRKLAIDLKYWALNLIPSPEDIASGTPHLIRFMGWRRAHAIHIVRRNKLRMLLSQQMSKETGVWGASTAENVPTEKPKLQVEPGPMIKHIERLILMEQKVRDMLAPLQNAQEIFYEEMFDPDGRFSDRFAEVACRAMDLTEIDRTPTNVRMNPEPVEALVENYGLLAEALGRTEHGWMLTAD